MPNIASVLKNEISRVARKEARAETQSLRKTTSQYRAEIAALKRRILALEQQVKRSGKTTRPAPRVQPEKTGRALRFSAKGLAKQRQRLELSANAVAKLLGVSALSVYNWEGGKTRPRASQLPAIAALRQMGKKDAAALFGALAE
jgi:DNA-binding transcriptional regulator YiaG